MSEIDVSDVLLGSEIAGTQFIVQRRQEAVGQDGFGAQQLLQLQAYGSVQPMEAELLREPEYDGVTNGIIVITPFRLRSASKAQGNNYKPDIILWNGNSYIVRRIENWSQYGAGFIKAECVSEDFIDQAPQ